MGTGVAEQTTAASFEARQEAPDATVLAWRGRLDTMAAGRLWRQALRAARPAGRLTLDLSGLTGLDTSGAALIVAQRRAAGGGEAAALRGASPPIQAVLDRVEAALATPPPAPERPLGPLAWLGHGAFRIAHAFGDSLAFLGETAITGSQAALRPWVLRRSEVLRHLDEVGTRAFPLVALLGVLIGVILAFQSAIPMRRFGAEIFIPNLVGISLLRELGPLMAAVILAGRTGSAFAAELGTMVVNEEVDALRIMGIDPLVLLVVPRLIAATLAMPVLALLMDLAGLLGMGGVMTGLGFPPAAIIGQLSRSVALSDLLGGLFKAAVFGLVVAGVGCHAGLSAGRGPRAVGDAATMAVVGGIVAIVVLDGMFAVLFSRLGL
jgi:phospholipid/cholesterol/gamma-HCH transport system permease protein